MHEVSKMKVSTTAERLRLIMDNRNLRQVDILNLAKPYCDKFDVKLGKNDVSQYVSGKVEPGQYKLTVLGMALGVSEVWLMGYDVPMERDDAFTSFVSNILPLPQTEPVPLIGTIACGKPNLAMEDAIDMVQAPKYFRADFALLCKGDSMINARIFDGDLVYIRKQPEVENGEIAAVRIDDEATLKKVTLYPDKIVLEAANPLYDPLVYRGEEMNQVEILGKAVGFTSMIV